MSEPVEDPTDIRYYGGDGTIHRNGEVNVETDSNGTVVAVWFRCQPLPFTQTAVEPHRAAEMVRMYGRMPREGIDALVLRRKQ
jgi:hypothetical protein